MDSQKPGNRVVLKRRSFQKWSAIPAALMLIAVIVVGGFFAIRTLGDHDSPSFATEPSDPVSTVPIDPINSIDYEQEYADVPEYLREHVILYAQALYEKWPQEEWERIGLNLELYQVKDHVECGFVLKDLDSDGLQDLLIYGGSQLYEILVVNYWPENAAMDVPNHTLWCFTHEEDESRMFLCEDNVIMITSVLNDRDDHISYNRLGKSEYGLSSMDMIETVFAIEGTEWFTGTNYENAVPITAEEAENITSDYKLEEVEPRLFPRNKVHEVDYVQQFANVDARYRPLLINYTKALKENWTLQKWEQAGLCQTLYEVEDKENFSYSLMDMDDNGVDELLIFGGAELYALYILRDDQPEERLSWKIHHGAQRQSILLCENDVVKICQKDSSGCTYTSFYSLGKDGLGATDLVMVDTAMQTPDGQWYAGPNEKDAVPVTEDEAFDMIVSYPTQSLLIVKFFLDNS